MAYIIRSYTTSAHYRATEAGAEILEAGGNAIEGVGIEDVMESRVACRQKGEPMRFRGATLMATIVEKVKLEIVAADGNALHLHPVITSYSIHYTKLYDVPPIAGRSLPPPRRTCPAGAAP